ncbi:MAG: mannitol dehydrogenase family protein [Betaproteobacteria bacterium]|nr:MAG: mannitol dehydrogenase family protein [Betaproteobacteria bacterium]
MKRIALSTLPLLAANVARPTYDVGALGIGIVHLGLGAFHRAHQAVYTDDAIASGGGQWGICGVSLKSSTARDQLAAQDSLYSVREVTGGADRWRVIGAIRESLFAGDQLSSIIARIAQAETHIVSLTVTEKGYCADINKREPLWTHPDIAHDLERVDQPISALGVLVAGLYERFRKRGAPMTILCCDNLPDNGGVLQALVHSFAARVHPQMLPWLLDNVAFPSSMVDRIVPATKNHDVSDSEAALGLRDEGVVRAEPFSQWVIEDKFLTPRPDWHRVGVQFVSDVAPFEAMKLRLLNGAHSLLAYSGALEGIDTIAETVARPAFRAAALGLMRESATSLDPVEGVDIERYQAQLLERFANPALGHRTWQVATDGSQKLPQRLVAPTNIRLARGQDSPFAAYAIAAWIVYLSERNFRGVTHTVADARAPHFSGLRELLRDDLQAFAAAVLDDEQVFAAVGKTPSFREEVLRNVALIDGDGTEVAAQEFDSPRF